MTVSTSGAGSVVHAAGHPVADRTQQRRAGWAAVGCAIVAFSLGSTMVKRADAPGVLIALWRMACTTVAWKAILVLSGRRPSMANVRRAVVPGVLFGLNITTFFIGATHNSVANAELIGSVTPLLVVPIGARLFGEFIDVRALSFALIAFAGVSLVLFAAPAAGDATLRGNVFCAMGMLFWAGYVTSTRYFRGDLDVVTFMASMLPVSTLTVLPIAMLSGGVSNLPAHAWTYVVLLTFVTGLGAHGLIVFAQSRIGIGTIGVAQVVQPALATVWSFLLIGEELRAWQFVGMVLVVAGLLAFLVTNQRSSRRAAAQAEPALP